MPAAFADWLRAWLSSLARYSIGSLNLREETGLRTTIWPPVLMLQRRLPSEELSLAVTLMSAGPPKTPASASETAPAKNGVSLFTPGNDDETVLVKLIFQEHSKAHSFRRCPHVFQVN